MVDPETKERKLILRSTDGTVETGCRFRYIEPVIPFGYKELVKALNDAIDKEAAEHEGKFVTDKRDTNVSTSETYDFDEMQHEFQTLTGKLMQDSPATYGPKIVAIVDDVLGKGKKVGETTPDQVDFVHEINERIKSELM